MIMVKIIRPPEKSKNGFRAKTKYMGSLKDTPEKEIPPIINSFCR